MSDQRTDVKRDSGRPGAPRVLPLACMSSDSSAPVAAAAAGGLPLSGTEPCVRQLTRSAIPRRLHLLTKHRVFSGPGFLVAQEVGDAAHGGQVLLTHDAWLELRNDMDQVRSTLALGESSKLGMPPMIMRSLLPLS